MPQVHTGVSLLKRWLLRTTHGGVQQQHLDIVSMNSHFASTAVTQTLSYCSYTAWLNKPLPSAQLLTVPLFIASNQYMRKGDTQFRLFDSFSSKHLIVAVLLQFDWLSFVLPQPQEDPFHPHRGQDPPPPHQ